MIFVLRLLLPVLIVLLQFMAPYKIPLPIEPGFISPFARGERAFEVEAINDTVDMLAGTRSLTLQITHPGLIWTGKQMVTVVVHATGYSLSPSNCL